MFLKKSLKYLQGAYLGKFLNSSRKTFEFLRIFSVIRSDLHLIGIIAACTSKKDDERKQISHSESALLHACHSGNVADVKRLLRRGVNPNVRHPLGWTPLHVAAMNGYSNIVRLLVEAGADPDAGDDFSNPFQMARERMSHSVYGFENPTRDFFGGFFQVFEEIVSPIDVLVTREEEFSERLSNEGSFRGFTPLHYGVLSGNLDTVRALLEAGANPNKENLSLHRPIDYASPNQKELLTVLDEFSEKYETTQKEKESEERRKYPLEKRLKDNLVGQRGAIAAVTSAIRRKESGWQDEDHPLVFLFLGSSGIGKTELAKQVAKHIHGDNRKGFIRLDMSEYQQQHEVSKLIGAPPGYVGYDEGGQLTTRLRECPNAVVLFDEVDKAHAEVLTTLLQLFDEGRLTDGKGDTIECKDALFIMTSNLANEEIADHGEHLRREALLQARHRDSQKKGQESREEDISLSKEFREHVVRPILKRHFRRDEFLGRINEIVYFLPFSKSELRSLVKRELDFWAEKAMKKHGIMIEWDGYVEDALADGYNPHYGARSIKHEVERRVVNLLASAHESLQITRGSLVKIFVDIGADIKEPTIEDILASGAKIGLKVKREGEKLYRDVDESSLPAKYEFM
ncbi:mitochondrial disaggregase-like isoform X2 [Artemia franciscana]|uniref:mitochondrial disaggregase-like isoform X2 n=1 Tax=Artemia franciscana TaxID=6661 RepID=UPI0032DA82DA